jgi:hypothetical protein
MKTSIKDKSSGNQAIKSDDERRLLPMLIWGLVLIVIGMVAVMAFV